MNLRPYQTNLIDRIRTEAQNGNRRILLMAPTGGGKTIIAKFIIDSAISKGKRVLFTVPRINLIKQTAEKFADSSIIQGQSKGFDASKNLQIATLQTLQNRELNDIDIVIIDEVHYGYDGEMIQSLLERYPKALFIGMSATPVNENGYLLDGFDTIIDEIQTCDLIDMNFLVPIECYSCAKIDTSKLRVVGGDYVESEIEPLVTEPLAMQNVLINYQKYANGLKFIGFCANKAHAIALTALFCANGYNVAYVSADTPDTVREQLYADLRSGKLIGLFSIEILTMGFDDGTIMAELLTTPTKAWRKYIQKVGRVIRLNGGTWEESVRNGKTKAIILDFGNNIEEHGLATDRKRLIFKSKISRTIDRVLNLETSIEKRKEIAPERVEFLRKVGSLLDLYDGKTYAKEQDLQDDVNNFLEKTGFFWWRQNSGVMYKDGKYIHFASKSGLPDCTMFYNYTSFFVGIELKLPKGSMTPHQIQTIPEMIQKGVFVWLAHSVFEVFECLMHLENNVVKTAENTIISNALYQLPEKQMAYRKKYFKIFAK